MAILMESNTIEYYQKYAEIVNDKQGIASFRQYSYPGRQIEDLLFVYVGRIRIAGGK